MRSGVLNMVIRSLLITICLGFSLTGMDCSKLLDSNTDNIADVVGNWTLQSQSGALYDVCAGEKVEFSLDHSAVLQCPGQTSITRTVTVTNGTITYQGSNNQYNYEVNTSTNPQQLTLTGVNISRNLHYLKIITASSPAGTTVKDSKIKNSSEK